MESISASSENVVFAQRNIDTQGPAREKSLNLLMGSLTEAAALAYGSGIGEGIKGGAGHIGVLNGKVVKFNTKSAERKSLDKGSETYGEMMKACDNLRNRLVTNLNQVGNLVGGEKSNFLPGTDKLKDLRQKLTDLLGLKLVDGKFVKKEGQFEIPNEPFRYQLAENRGLLTRAAVAKSVTLIRDFLRDHVKTGEAAAEAPSSLVKNAEAGERADFDFHIWSKVKAMKGLSSQAISMDGFTHSKQVAAAMREVAAFKYTAARYRVLQDVGNEKMKAAISPIWRKSQAMAFDKVELKMGGVLYSGISHQKAQEMVNAFRLESMAGAMDAMYAELHKMYAARHPESGAAEAGTPFHDIFIRSFAKLRGKTEQEIAELSPENRRLSLNELRNVKAMMRNELLAYVVDQGNEFEPGKAGAAPKVSVKVMLDKDLFVSCSRLLDIDGEAGDSSYVVGMNVDDRTGRYFREDDKGKSVFGENDYKIFTDFSYGPNFGIIEDIGHEKALEDEKDTATKNVLDELFDKSHEVQVSGSDEPASITFANGKFRDLARTYVRSALEKLQKPASRDPQTVGRIREDFIRKVVQFDLNANVDTRRYVLDENDERDYSAPEMKQKLAGDIFDRYIASFEWPNFD